MEQFKIEIAGNSYELKYTTRAICQLEKLLGYSVLSAKFITDATTERTVAMLWAGLLHSNKALTLDDVYDLIDSSGVMVLKALPQLNAAFSYFWGLSENKENVATDEKKTET